MALETDKKFVLRTPSKAPSVTRPIFQHGDVMNPPQLNPVDVLKEPKTKSV